MKTPSIKNILSGAGPLVTLNAREEFHRHKKLNRARTTLPIPSLQQDVEETPEKEIQYDEMVRRPLEYFPGQGGSAARRGDNFQL